MEMHQIRYFLALAEELSFTRASQKCHVSQPSLTRAIGKLESEIGGKVVHRRQGRIELTDVGRSVLPHFREIVTRVEAVRVQAKFKNSEAETHLRLGVACEVTSTCLSTFLANFGQRHPSIALEISILHSGTIERLLKAENIDAAISSRPGCSSSEFEYLTLYREPIDVVLHPGDPLVVLDSVSLGQLQNKPYLARADCEIDRDIVRGAFGTELRSSGRSERDEWLVSMVAIGMGFALLPRSRSSHAEVVTRPMAGSGFQLQIGLVTASRRPRSPALASFLDELVGYYRVENARCAADAGH